MHVRSHTRHAEVCNGLYLLVQTVHALERSVSVQHVAL